MKVLLQLFENHTDSNNGLELILINQLIPKNQLQYFPEIIREKDNVIAIQVMAFISS